MTDPTTQADHKIVIIGQMIQHPYNRLVADITSHADQPAPPVRFIELDKLVEGGATLPSDWNHVVYITADDLHGVTYDKADQNPGKALEVHLSVLKWIFKFRDLIELVVVHRDLTMEHRSAIYPNRPGTIVAAE